MNEKDLKVAIDRYGKMSGDELMVEFAAQIAKQKAKDGGVNMRKTIERILPLCNPEQRKRLEDLLRRSGV